MIAHRGDVSNAPENTLPAFRRAYDSGADGIELDVRLTSDNRLVVFHDRSLRRIGGVRGLVTNATLDEMRSLDAGGWFGREFRGERVPTLDEVFELLPRGFLINVEMKAVIDRMRLIAHRVAETVRRHQRWGSTLVASFNPISLWELRKVDPSILRGYIWSRRHPPPIAPAVSVAWSGPTGTIPPTTATTRTSCARCETGAFALWHGTLTSRGTCLGWPRPGWTPLLLTTLMASCNKKQDLLK